MNTKIATYCSMLSAMLLVSVSAGDMEHRIANGILSVAVDSEDGAFSISRLQGNPAMTARVTLALAGDAVDVKAVQDKTLGKGKAILFKHGSISLYKDVPFAILRADIRNTDDKEALLDRVVVTSFGVQAEASELNVLGTGGLTSIEDAEGSYSWIAAAAPDTRAGLVAGWVTHHRASGIMLPSYKAGAFDVDARAEYGSLRLDPGAKEESEMLAIGVFEDARFGLEHYADLIAEVHDINLPPRISGHCTWYHARASNERELPGLTEFAAKELGPYGFSFFQIDDGWQAGPKRNGPAKDFSDYNRNGPYKTIGMKGTADIIKENGLIPGLWLIPFAGTVDAPAFADRQQWFVKKRDNGEPYKVKWGGTCFDLTRPEVQQYVHDIIKRITHEWGFRYLKLDGLWTGMAAKIRYVNDSYRGDGLENATFHDPDFTNVQAYRKGLKVVRDAAGPDIFLLGCNMAQNMRTMGASFGLLDAMRVGPDNASEWLLRGEKRLMAGPRTGTRNYFLNRRVWHNDPDPVFVRKSMPLKHARLICSWVSLSGQLIVASDNLRRLPPERLDILKRSLEPHHATARPVDLFEDEVARIWLITDDKGDVRRDVVALYNWDDYAYRFDYPLKKIGLQEDSYVGFDYWGDKVVEPIRDRLTVTLPAQSCLVLAVKPVADIPQVLSTSRHVTQGMVDVLEEKWDSRSSTLSGVSRVVANDPYELRILLPKEMRVAADDVAVETGNAASNVQAEVVSVQDRLCRVKLVSKTTCDVEWKIRSRCGETCCGTETASE